MNKKKSSSFVFYIDLISFKFIVGGSYSTYNLCVALKPVQILFFPIILVNLSFFFTDMSLYKHTRKKK